MRLLLLFCIMLFCYSSQCYSKSWHFTFNKKEYPAVKGKVYKDNNHICEITSLITDANRHIGEIECSSAKNLLVNATSFGSEYISLGFCTATYECSKAQLEYK